MKIFRDYTLHWWQASLLKVCVLAFGIIVGVYWSAFF